MAGDAASPELPTLPNALRVLPDAESTVGADSGVVDAGDAAAMPSGLSGGGGTVSAASLTVAGSGESLGKPSTTTLSRRPAISSWGLGRLDVFARGDDGNLWHNWFSNGWGTWENLGHPSGTFLGSSPAAVSWSSGRIDVFAIGNDQKMYHLWYSNGWQPWEQKGLTSPLLGSWGPAVSSWTSQRLDIFARDSNAVVRHMFYDLNNGGWNQTWNTVTGPTAFADVSAVSWGSNRIDLASVNGSFIDHRWVSDGSNNFATESLTPYQGSFGFTVPALSSRANSLLDMFYDSTADSTLTRTYYDEAWSGDTSTLALSANTEVAAASWGPGRNDVVWTNSSDGAMYHAIVGAAAVPTQHNDLARSGANTEEVELNTSNVNANHFGMLFRVNLDGEVYAQPLYQSTLAVAGKGTRNVVFVATTHDTVYMFDADDASQDSYSANPTPPLATWHIPTIQGYPVPLPQNDIGGGCNAATNLWESGITSTPVLDAAQGVLFVETFSSNVQLSRRTYGDGCPAQPTHAYSHYLHALSTADLHEIAFRKLGQGLPAGQWIDANEQQRVALTELSGRIYVAFGGYVDRGPYHGWVLEYTFTNNAFSANPTSYFATTNPATGNGGGIWQSGQGLASDGTYLYLETGNGDYDHMTNWGNTVLKLAVNPLAWDDYFTPSNQNDLNAHDLDIGSAGPVVLNTSPKRLLAGSKLGAMWMLDPTGASTMGRYNAAAFESVPSFLATQDNSACGTYDYEYHDILGPFGNIHGSPAYLVGSDGNAQVFVWGEEDYLRSYILRPSTSQFVDTTTDCDYLDHGDMLHSYVNSGQPPDCPLGTIDGGLWNSIQYLNSYGFGVPTSASQQQTTDSQSSSVRAPCGMPGGILSLSANGTAAGTSIVWATLATPQPVANNLSAITCSISGSLFAFDAANVSHVLWSSDYLGCGAAGMACCGGSTCATGLTCNSGTCSNPAGCGLPGQACCTTGAACTNGDSLCDGGVCNPNAVGLHGKFVPPTVANGKVYVVSHGIATDSGAYSSNPANEATGANPGVHFYQSGYNTLTCSSQASPPPQLVVYGILPSARRSP